MPRPLDRYRQRALVLGARTRLAPRLDHPAVGDKAADARHVLIIYVLDAIHAERADLPSRKAASTPAAKTARSRPRRSAFAALVPAPPTLLLISHAVSVPPWFSARACSSATSRTARRQNRRHP